MITQENWQNTFYRNDERAAIVFISAGAELNEESQIQELYYVTMTNFDRDEEYFQQTFKNLDLAIKSINNKYSFWSFVTPESKSGSGCGSCEAH